MKPSRDISELMEKAKPRLFAAQILFNEGLWDFSASRSYYAMFYAAEAILLSKKLAFSKHSAVISAFGKEFIKTEILPKPLHRYLREAFKLRQAGDYGSSTEVEKPEAQKLMEEAKEFIDSIRDHLSQK